MTTYLFFLIQVILKDTLKQHNIIYTASLTNVWSLYFPFIDGDGWSGEGGNENVWWCLRRKFRHMSMKGCFSFHKERVDIYINMAE